MADDYTLVLMRHSKAEQMSVNGDFNRELVPLGRRKASRAGKKLAKKVPVFDEIISSNALRAFQTAEIVSKSVDFDEHITKLEELYIINANHFLDVIKRSDGNSVLIVGHEPVISEVASLLIDRKTEREATRLALQELRFGISTANFVILRSKRPFASWKWGAINKAKLVHID